MHTFCDIIHDYIFCKDGFRLMISMYFLLYIHGFFCNEFFLRILHTEILLSKYFLYELRLQDVQGSHKKDSYINGLYRNHFLFYLCEFYKTVCVQIQEIFLDLCLCFHNQDYFYFQTKSSRLLFLSPYSRIDLRLGYAYKFSCCKNIYMIKPGMSPC